MDKLKIIVKGLFSKNQNLTAIMNKSRIFNTYCACAELTAILFFISIPGRTNQANTVSLFVI